jgi:peptidoglycan/LPS O-acetylase OafA/YrhL
MNAIERRYDIDWLRVIAIGLLLIYHMAIGFQPWGIFIGFIKNDESLESLWVPLSMLNVWRIPILFFVSGMGVYFAIQRRNWKELLQERALRILLPFLFGMVAIVPLHVFVWQHYYHQDISYMLNPAHLWFLGNIFIYVLVLLPLFFYLKNSSNNRFRNFLQRLFRNPLALAIITIPFILESEIIQPDSFELYAMTWHGFVLGFIAFLMGFICVYSGNAFWETVTRWRWILFILAAGMYILRVVEYDMRTPDYMMSIESNLWIFTVFGFTHKYLNKHGKVLRYLSEAAYPVYIIHMVFLYAGSAVLFPMEISAPWKFVLLTVFTIASCMLTYEFVIRRIPFLRPLFGLKSGTRINRIIGVERI